MPCRHHDQHGLGLLVSDQIIHDVVHASLRVPGGLVHDPVADRGGAVPGVPAAHASASSPGLPSLIPSAPIADAAGTLPTPPAAVIPTLAQGVATLLSPPQFTIPGIPGLGIPLPTTISGPHDLLCTGTGWSATKAGAASGAPAGAVLGADLPKAGRWFDN